MTTQPGRAALVASLKDWRRHSVALGVVVVAFGIAFLLSSEIAYYGAWLLTFAVWMAWFVLTAIEWIRHADF